MIKSPLDFSFNSHLSQIYYRIQSTRKIDLDILEKLTRNSFSVRGVECVKISKVILPSIRRTLPIFLWMYSRRIRRQKNRHGIHNKFITSNADFHDELIVQLQLEFLWKFVINFTSSLGEAGSHHTLSINLPLLDLRFKHNRLCLDWICLCYSGCWIVVKQKW